jgi:hypothetical protein
VPMGSVPTVQWRGGEKEGGGLARLVGSNPSNDSRHRAAVGLAWPPGPERKEKERGIDG